MNLTDGLKKIYLNGLNSVCAVEKDLSISVMDETGSVLTVVRPIDGENMLDASIGIRDVNTFINVLSNASEDSFEQEGNNIEVTDEDGRVSLKLADIDAIPRVPDVDERCGEVSEEERDSSNCRFVLRELKWEGWSE